MYLLHHLVPEARPLAPHHALSVRELVQAPCSLFCLHVSSEYGSKNRYNDACADKEGYVVRRIGQVNLALTLGSGPDRTRPKDRSFFHLCPELLISVAIYDLSIHELRVWLNSEVSTTSCSWWREETKDIEVHRVFITWRPAGTVEDKN